MEVKLAFRSDYYAQLFAKRMRKAWGLVKPVVKPKPAPTPKTTPKSKAAPTPKPPAKSTGETVNADRIESGCIILAIGFLIFVLCLVRLLTTSRALGTAVFTRCTDRLSNN